MSAQLQPVSSSATFDPAEPGNARAFRGALGRFATGVTVVTCDSAQGPLGITANSFASVSLDPPLILWSPAKSSARFDSFTTTEHFAVHVMSADQAAICNGFAKEAGAFDGFDWRSCDHNVPLIQHCLARFECTRHAVHDGGDHAIVVGRVSRVTTQDGAPLMFYSGKFGGFTE